MKTKSTLLMFLTPFITIAIVITGIYLLLSILWNETRYVNGLIKNFHKNETLFEEMAKELYQNEEDYIYLSKENGNIYITLHQNMAGKVDIVKVQRESFYKYEKTIHLMEELSLTDIKKEKDNIIIPFDSLPYSQGHYIVQLNNEDRFQSRGYTIEKKTKIKDNWYYVKVKP